MRRLGEGAWAEVFAVGDDRCLKRARPVALAQKDSDAQGVAQGTGSLGKSLLQPHDVLIEQGKQLQAIHHPGWVRCHDIVSDEGRVALLLDRVPGRGLKRGDSPALLASVAEALVAGPHLDLKPNNILVNGDKAVLIDPGYADHLPHWSNLITTVAYNPFLDVNDVASLGLLLRFVLTGDPPVTDVGTTLMSKNVADAIAAGRALGRHGLALVTSLPDKPLDKFAPIVWRALGMKRDADGCFHLEEAYATPAQFANALRKVL